MPALDAVLVRFQCPKCGHELKQTVGKLKANALMRCRGCGVSINIDTDNLANVADEIKKALEKDPPEITIKFHR